MAAQVVARRSDIGLDIREASRALLLGEYALSYVLKSQQQLEEVATQDPVGLQGEVEFRDKLSAQVWAALLGQDGERGAPPWRGLLALAIVGKGLAQMACLVGRNGLGLQVLEGRDEARIPSLAQQLARVEQALSCLKAASFERSITVRVTSPTTTPLSARHQDRLRKTMAAHHLLPGAVTLTLRFEPPIRSKAKGNRREWEVRLPSDIQVIRQLKLTPGQWRYGFRRTQGAQYATDWLAASPPRELPPIDNLHLVSITVRSAAYEPLVPVKAAQQADACDATLIV